MKGVIKLSNASFNDFMKQSCFGSQTTTDFRNFLKKLTISQFHKTLGIFQKVSKSFRFFLRFFESSHSFEELHNTLHFQIIDKFSKTFSRIYDKDKVFLNKDFEKLLQKQKL